MRWLILIALGLTVPALLLWARVANVNICGVQSTLCGKVPADIRAIELACELYAERNAGKFPTDLSQLLGSDTSAGFLRSRVVPLDPWQRPYLYAPTDDHCHDPRIWTYGRDGLPGGVREDADVDNWDLRQL